MRNGIWNPKDNRKRGICAAAADPSLPGPLAESVQDRSGRRCMSDRA